MSYIDDRIRSADCVVCALERKVVVREALYTIRVVRSSSAEVSALVVVRESWRK